MKAILASVKKRQRELARMKPTKTYHKLLTLIETKEDIHSKIILKRRDISSNSPNSNNATLQKVVSHIIDILEK